VNRIKWLKIAALFLLVLLSLQFAVSAAAETPTWPWPTYTKYPMSRGFSSSHNGIDAKTNGQFVEVFSPFTGTANYYQCYRPLSDGRKVYVSYGKCVEITNGEYTVVIAHLSQFEKVGYVHTDIIDATEVWGNDVVANAGWITGVDKKDPCGTVEVKKGQLLGISGSSGRSSGPHLHITVKKGTEEIDPQPLFDQTVCAKVYYNGGGSSTPSTPTPPPSSSTTLPCGCFTTAAGIYTCTTTSVPLNIRSSHSTESKALGKIPSGATVHVSAAGKGWAHVSYGGISGYASTQYLKRSDSGTGIFVNGTSIVYDHGDVYSTDEEIIAANRRFADYCQNTVYGVNYTEHSGCFGILSQLVEPMPGWTYVLKNGMKFTIAESDGLYSDIVYLFQQGNKNIVTLEVMKNSDFLYKLQQLGFDHIELWNYTGVPGGGGSAQTSNPTAMTPEIIVHIDHPAGKYDGSDHIEISGWIASRQQLTYVMGECEAFGQMNLTDSLTDASAELNAAGYSAYPYKYRYRSVIDRKYLQPNTTYTMKVWAGMANGGTSGVCAQSFDVTSIEPTVIRHTQPSGSNLTGGKDVTVAGTIVSLNPITDAKAKLADINGSTQQLEFDLKLTQNNALVSGSKYTYGYNFTGTLPMALVKASNTTATVFVTAIDQNHIQKTEPKTYTIGTVVRGDINSYEFVYDQESVRVEGSDSKTLTGVVHANAPIADVMALIHKWDSSSGNITIANVTEATPKSGYHYAKKFSLTISAGDLCDTLGVDSFTDAEFRVRFWCDLVSDSGEGVHKECANERKVFGSNVSTNYYSVKYNANGGTGAPSSQSVKHNKGLTLSSAVPTRTGCSFKGWATSSGSSDVKYAPGSTYKTNASVTLYAVWEKAVDIPTNLISYDTTANITIKNAPKVYKLVPSAATKYRFTASGSAGANVVIQDASGAAVASFSGASSAAKEILLSDNQTYYIVVKPNTANATGSVKLNVLRSYAVNFDANGGTGAPTETLYQFAGESVTLPDTIPEMAPVVITYDAGEGTSPITTESCPVTFNSWANYDFRSANFYAPGESIPFGRSLTLSAEWEYPLMGEIIVPEQEGKIFTGWVDSNGVEVDGDYLLLEDVTLYARWVDEISLEGIKLTPKSMELEMGDMAQLTVSAVPSGAILPDIVFTSSNPYSVTVSATGMVEILAPGVSTITASTADGMFGAQSVITVGEPIFDVAYDLNGASGDAPPAVTVHYGDPYALPDMIPERTGHRFLGWADAPDAAQPLYLAGENAVIERSITFYAVWEKKAYPVIYDACGGENAPESQIKVYGEPLMLNEDAPTRENYYFEGWALQPMAAKADYQPGAVYEANAPLMLFALWRAHATGISLNYPVLVLSEGVEKTLKASLQPADAAGSALLWHSSNEQVASIADGRITARAAGQAVITCTVAENTQLSAACRVTVTPAYAGGEAPEAPQMQTVTACQGDSVQVAISFYSADAAYAKLLFSYDTTALTLTNVSVNSDAVTTGPNALVLALADGIIPEGAQAILTFAVSETAPTGLHAIDVAVAEAFTHDEAATILHAAAADTVHIFCAEHQPVPIAPVPATRSESGLGAGIRCAVCETRLIEQEIIQPDRVLWLPKNLKTLENEALMGLSMQQAVLPEGMQTIGSRTFADCHDLLLIVMPESVQIAPDAFEGCEALYLLSPDGVILDQPTP